MIALFGQRCTERKPARPAIQGKPMYLTIRGEGDHPEVKKLEKQKLHI